MSNIINKLPKLDLDKSKNIILIVAVLVIIYIIIVFGKDIVDGVESFLGIKKDPNVTAAQQSAIDANMSSANPSSPFSPQLYNNNPEASTLDYATLKDMADRIYGTVSLLPNWLSPPDPATGLANIKRCNNKIDVSNLVVVFQQIYSQDLYDFLSHNYTNDQGVLVMQQIINYVNSLPTT